MKALVAQHLPYPLFAGDFLGDDYSTLYAISYDNNNLYAIDTHLLLNPRFIGFVPSPALPVPLTVV